MKKIQILLCSIAILFGGNVSSQVILNESFDNAVFVPTGWYKAKISPLTNPTFGQWNRVTTGTAPTTTTHSGAGMAQFLINAGLGTISELGTPALDFSSGNRYRLRFWTYRTDYGAAGSDILDVYASTQPNIATATKLTSIFTSRAKSPTEPANGWYQYVCDIPATYNTASNYIIFRATSGSANSIHIDDVSVETFTCNQPISPNVGTVLSNSASLSWTAPATGTPAGYEWEVRTNGSAGTGTNGLVANGITGSATSNATAAGLVPGANHYFYVRTTCGTENSTWTTPVSFVTPCGTATIPYSENFDGIGSGIPNCTSTENINGGNTWTSVLPVYGSTYGKSAPNALSCTIGGSGATGAQNDWFYTLPLQMEAGKCYQLSFAYRSFSVSYTQSLKAGVGSGANAAAMTTILFNNASFTNDAYAASLSTFSVATTGIYYIGFNHYGTTGGSGPVIIDDISVTESIGSPGGINANPVDATTAQLNWTTPSCGVPSGYDYELRTSGTAGSGATGLAASATVSGLTTTLTGLSENKIYNFYIRAKNGALLGTWSTAVPFATGCSIRTLPYIQNFDGVISPAMPPCIIKQDLNTVYNALYNSWQNVSYDFYNSLPNSMRVGTNNSTYAANNWFFTPPFNFIAGKSYRLIFYYRNGVNYTPEKLEIKYGPGANAAAMTSTAIFSNTDIRNTTFTKAAVDFMPAQNGVYNIGFHSFSDPVGNFIYIDDLSVEEIGPDLIISNQTLSTSTAPTAGTITANFTVNNQGTGDAAAHNTYFYLSADNILTPGANGDTLIGDYSIAATIAANTNTGNLGKQLTIPCTITPGNYTLFIVADGSSLVNETNENNNTAAAATTITQGPGAPLPPVITAGPAAIVCNGGPVTLSVDSANCATCSYSWNTGAAGGSLLAIASGNYTVTVTNTCGSNTASQQVAINTTPVINVSASTTAVCIGSPVTLSATGADAYTWSGQGLSASTGASVAATPANTGTTVYTVTGTTNGCPQTKTIDIIVNAIPNVLIGLPDTAICNATSITINATGASTYTWTGPGLSSNTGNSVTAQPTGIGTFAYNVTGTSSGCSQTKSVNISTIAFPVVSILQHDTAVCSGTPVTLDASGAAGYTWSPAGSLNNTNTATVIATASSTTVYTVNGKTNGCGASASVTITALPPVVPAVNINYSGCETDTLHFTATAINAGSNPGYQWTVNNVVTGTGPAFAMKKPTINAVVNCMITSNAACASPSTATASATLSCLSTGIRDIDELQSFMVSPNPSPGNFVIHLQLLKLMKISFTVWGTTGKMIFASNPQTRIGAVEQQINLGGDADGIYYLITVIGGKQITTKLVKQN